MIGGVPVVLTTCGVAAVYEVVSLASIVVRVVRHF